MVGIVVAAHGHLASEVIASAELILGPLPLVASCNIGPALSPEALEAELEKAVRQVDGDSGVLVLTDLLGGTPCTRSMALCRKHRLEVISGVNLPMLIKANSLRKANDLSAREVASQLIAAVRASICWVTEDAREEPALQGHATSS